MSIAGAEMELKSVNTEVSMTASAPCVNVSFTVSGTGAHTQLVSSTNIAPTPHIVESQVTSTQSHIIQQREQSRVDALRTTSGLRGVNGTTIPPQVILTTTPAVVSGLILGETDEPLALRQVPVGSIAPSAEGYIWPGHPDAQYVNVFPPKMSLSQPLKIES